MYNNFLPSHSDMLEKGDCEIIKFPPVKPQQNFSSPQKSQKRQLRRTNKRIKERNLKKILSHQGYNPWPGYIVVTEDGKAEYIRYMRSSRGRVFLKKQTSRRNRRIPFDEVCLGKNNKYRRCLDFWWELF